MEHCKILRINELSRKSKGEGLTAEEKQEQYELRREYLCDMKRNFQETLDKVVIIDADGNSTCLKKKEAGNE